VFTRIDLKQAFQHFSEDESGQTPEKHSYLVLLYESNSATRTRTSCSSQHVLSTSLRGAPSLFDKTSQFQVAARIMGIKRRNGYQRCPQFLNSGSTLLTLLPYRNLKIVLKPIRSQTADSKVMTVNQRESGPRASIRSYIATTFSRKLLPSAIKVVDSEWRLPVEVQEWFKGQKQVAFSLGHCFRDIVFAHDKCRKAQGFLAQNRPMTLASQMSNTCNYFERSTGTPNDEYSKIILPHSPFHTMTTTPVPAFSIKILDTSPRFVWDVTSEQLAHDHLCPVPASGLPSLEENSVSHILVD
jgi:hypothetical protein